MSDISSKLPERPTIDQVATYHAHRMQDGLFEDLFPVIQEMVNQGATLDEAVARFQDAASNAFDAIKTAVEVTR